jgi:uncharacterized membrane protein YgcG
MKFKSPDGLGSSLLLGVALLPVLLFVLATPARTQGAAGVPEYEGEFFTDLTHKIPVKDKVDIGRTLRNAAQVSMVHPMLVLIDKMSAYPSMPQEIKGFANKLATEWKIGEVSTKKGILALFSVEDRKFFIARTKNLDQSVTDQIRDGFKGRAVETLKSGDLNRAMKLAADTIATTLPAGIAARSTTPRNTGGHTITRTTHEHRVGAPTYSGRRNTLTSGAGEERSSGPSWLVWIGIGLMALLAVQMLSSLFMGGQGQGSGGPGYGGGGGGGGGFFSGMLTGGLLGYMFSGSSLFGGGSHSQPQDHSYTDTTTTETTNDTGPSVDGGGGHSGSSFDDFGGGDFDGGGSDGNW